MSTSNIVKPHPAYPQYGADASGNAYSRHARHGGGWRRLRAWVDRCGYCNVRICSSGRKRQMRVHHLVLECFGFPRTKGAVTRHLNGNRADNRVLNLAWGTYSENNGPDKVIHGTSNRGERHGVSRLSARDVREIRRLIGTRTLKEIAANFNVDKSTISCIKRGISWRWLS